MCGQVSGPSERIALARSRTAPSNPSAPPIRKQTGWPSPSQRSSSVANPALSGACPPGSSATAKGRDQGRALSALGLGWRPAPLGNLRDGERRAQAGAVAREQVELRPRAQASDGDQVQHRASLAERRSLCNPPWDARSQDPMLER